MAGILLKKGLKGHKGHKGLVQNRDPELIAAQVECLFLAHKLIFGIHNRRTIWLGLEHDYRPTSPFDAGADRSHLGAYPGARPAFAREPRRIAHHHWRDWGRE